MSSESHTQLPTYVPSGLIGKRAILMALLVGVPTSLIAGWFYVWARASTGSFVSVALCDLLFLTVAAVAVGMLVGTMQSRSRAFNTVFAMAWVGGMLLPWWLYLIGGSDQPDTTTDLPAQARLLSWGLVLGGRVLEALLLGLVAALVAHGMADAPFSEVAKKAGEKDFVGELYWQDDDRNGLLSRLRRHGVAPLQGAPLASAVELASAASAWVTIKLTGRQVESDPSARWLDVAMVLNERTEDGRVKTTSDMLVSAWQLSDADYTTVRHQFREAAAEADPLPAQEPESKKQREPEPLPAELEAAYSAMQSDNFAAALAMARAHCMHPVDNVRADAYRLCALSLSRMERWGEAFADYHELFEMEPSAFNALQLASTSVMDGQLLRAEAWFDRANEINRQTTELPPPRLRTNYLSALEQAGELGACRPHLDWLANGYRAMQPLDSHRLWMADMPQLGEFLQRSRQLLSESMSASELRGWYGALREDLDEDARALIDRHIASLA